MVDFVLSWDPRPNRPVDLLNVDEIMLMLAKHYNIEQVTFDRWNADDSIQKLVAEGIDADDMTFSNAEQLAMYRYPAPLLLQRHDRARTRGRGPGSEKIAREIKSAP